MWTDQDREKYKADGRRYPSDLTDAEWDIIKPLFTGYFTFTADMREVVNGCFYLEHTGCPWRSLPTDFGAHQTVRTWYDRFRTDGVSADAAAQLTRRVRKAHGRSEAVCRHQALISWFTRRTKRRDRMEMKAISMKATRCPSVRSKMVFNRR